ncbi:MAG: HAMP domain-containing histidine kinase [Chloroflexi bacterium]|nr:HAMP domain-containing histidine kinase [Chloroflexota bacterium]
MTVRGMTGRLRARLGVKLFMSYLAVIVVGVGTLWVAVSLIAPPAFTSHMTGMMDGGMMPGGMMGQASSNQIEASTQDAFRAAVGEALIAASVLALVTAGVVSAFVTGRVVGPIRSMARASRRLANGAYSERMASDSGDEIGELAESFNALAATLEATERRRLELIGDVAHELRTPVATLQVYLEGLLDGVVEPNEDTWAQMHDETGRLRRLIDDLQELSRAEAHQLSMDMMNVSPVDIAKVAVERLAPRFASQEIEVTLDVPPSLPHIRADRDRAIQVLTNLLSNALRYTPAPGKVVVAGRAQDGFVELTVADTGIGIAADELPRVFDRFYRVDKSRSRALGGAGVGLTIARALVETMGGRIWAESDGPGRGSTFRFTLPVATPAVTSQSA